jgi:hypothetical protein
LSRAAVERFLRRRYVAPSFMNQQRLQRRLDVAAPRAPFESARCHPARLGNHAGAARATPLDAPITFVLGVRAPAASSAGRFAFDAVARAMKRRHVGTCAGALRPSQSYRSSEDLAQPRSRTAASSSTRAIDFVDAALVARDAAYPAIPRGIFVLQQRRATARD